MGVVCPVKIAESFDLQPYQNSHLFFNGRKLRLPGNLVGAGS